MGPITDYKFTKTIETKEEMIKSNNDFLPVNLRSSKPKQLNEVPPYNYDTMWPNYGQLMRNSLLKLDQLHALLHDSTETPRQLMGAIENLMEQISSVKGRFLESIAEFQTELYEVSNDLVLKTEERKANKFGDTPEKSDGLLQESEHFKLSESPFLVCVSAKSIFKQRPTMLDYIGMATDIYNIQSNLKLLINTINLNPNAKKKGELYPNENLAICPVKHRPVAVQRDDILISLDDLNRKVINMCDKVVIVPENVTKKVVKPKLLRTPTRYANYLPPHEIMNSSSKHKQNEDGTVYLGSEELLKKHKRSSFKKCALMKKNLSKSLLLQAASRNEQLHSKGKGKEKKRELTNKCKEIQRKIHSDVVRRIKDCLKEKVEETFHVKIQDQPSSSKMVYKTSKCNCLHAVYEVLKGCQSRTVLTLSNHHEKVTISPTTSEVVHYVNDSHIVICNFPKEAKAQWITPKGDVITERKGRVHVEEKQSGQLALVFEQIALVDKGEWTCMIEDGAKKSFRMVINRPISFMDTAILQSAKEGKDANIRCEVRGDPEPTVSWSFNGKSIILPHAKFTKLADGLLIKKVSKNDSGEYTCRAFQISETINEVDERVILLKIEHKPLPVEKSADVQYGYINGVVNLTCEALAEPQANFSWYRHGKKISPKVHQIFMGNHSSMLQIPIKEATAFGDYKCKATNPLGFLEKMIKLQEGTKPDPPTQFTLRGVNSDTFDIDVGAVRISNIRDEMDINGYTFQAIPEHEWRASGGNWEKAREFKFGFEDGVTFLITNLAPNTTYLVRVASKNLAGLSDWTETKKFTTYPKEPMMTSAFNRICPFSAWDTLTIAIVTTFVSSYSASDSINILRSFHVIL